MARAAESVEGLRVPLLDARRGEVFGAVYAAHGSEVRSPLAIARERALSEFPGEATFLGEVAAELGATRIHRSSETDLPDAGYLALVASELPLDASIREPLYVRDAGATLPNLPPSPFSK
jgi:tRNA A37 threonylcarbamoyladenosine modification protein TsaB